MYHTGGMEKGKQTLDEHKACIHHWVIDERNLGVCRKCGAGKQFPVLTDLSLLMFRELSRKPSASLYDM